jgi:hypothetical protein
MNIFDKITAGKYKPAFELPFPVRRPSILDFSLADASEKLLAQAMLAKQEYDLAKQEFYEQTIAWRAEEQRLLLVFRSDLESEFEMSGHPKADPVFQKAWDLGHSDGLYEVAWHYRDLADLVKA